MIHLFLKKGQRKSSALVSSGLFAHADVDEAIHIVVGCAEAVDIVEILEDELVCPVGIRLILNGIRLVNGGVGAVITL